MTYGKVGSWGQAEKDLAFEFKKSQEAAIIFNALRSATADVNRNGETRQFLTMSGLFAQITSGVTLSRTATAWLSVRVPLLGWLSCHTRAGRPLPVTWAPVPA